MKKQYVRLAFSACEAIDTCIAEEYNKPASHYSPAVFRKKRDVLAEKLMADLYSLWQPQMNRIRDNALALFKKGIVRDNIGVSHSMARHRAE